MDAARSGRLIARRKQGCGALIVNEANEVLLLKRSEASRNDRLLWSQPGGAVDSDAPLESHVVREIKEELDVHVSLQGFLTTTSHEDDAHSWYAYSYLAKIESGTPKLAEPLKHTELRWFSLDSLPIDLNKVTKDSINALRRSRTQLPVEGLVVLDADGTLIRNSTSTLELCRDQSELDLAMKFEREFVSGAMSSHDFAEAMSNFYQSLSESWILEAFGRSELLKDLVSFVQWCKASGIVTAIVSTGPTFFLKHFKTLYGVEHVFGSEFLFSDRSKKLINVLDSGDKPVVVRKLASTLSLDDHKIVCIGDSFSDLPLFKTYTSTVALNAISELQSIAQISLNTDTALDLIPAVRRMLEI
jgi:HAD superfamily phosphoserine phosphatase-like hydrolase